MLDSMMSNGWIRDSFSYQVLYFDIMTGLDSFPLGLIFWYYCVFFSDDLEGSDGGYWVRVSHSGGAQWQHGASLPEGGLVVSHQLGGGDQSWRDSCFQD